ncbi:MAG TPA: hypothetical protein DCS05_12695 [Nitrospiraceae bacterium]|nr:hypothetical protein [Nitrospiraceae bacterium]
MAKIPSGTTVSISLPDGTASMKLREPGIEELNIYQAEKFNVPETATPAEGMAHVKAVQAAFFDKLLVSVEGLEGADDKPITLENKHLIPADWKSEAIFRRFDRTPVSIKN